jgi:hypothetical protein
MEWSSSLIVGVGLKTPRPNKISLVRNVTKGLGLGRIIWINDLSKKKMDMRFGTWKVRSVFRAGSLMTVVGCWWQSQKERDH